jgi:tRNA (cmo5U34)-methyltransferase
MTDVSQRWTDPAKVEEYLDRVPKLAARQAGEAMLLALLPPAPRRIVDLGCGDGRLAALVLEACPTVESAVVVDNSPPMLALARARFAADGRVEVVDADLADGVAAFGPADVVVSGFAIHHLEHAGKAALFGEVAGMLRPGGLFANLEVVASATAELHADFLAAIGKAADDPEDRLAAVDEQLRWMRDAGLQQVDCLWRWRGFALLAGRA